MTNSKIKLNLDSLKSRREWKRHKVKDGHNIFRVLPPFGEASNGYPYRKWQIIWGLVDPESGRARPFASSMTSEKRCPIVEFVGELKKRAESIRSQMAAAGSSDEEIKARLKDLNELISDLSPKTVYIYNAADKSGEVGLLELKSTAHKKMKVRMNEYINDYNQDPTSLNSADDDSGVWFNIIRQGMGRDTEYDVKRHQTKTKTAQGQLAFLDDRSPLPDSVVDNYENLAYDLTSVYQVKTYEQLQEILNYNLPGIIERVPDAALGQPVGSSVSVSATVTQPLKQGTGRVSLKIDDGDDDDDQVSTPKNLMGTAAPGNSIARSTTGVSRASAPVAKTGPAILDDDFMAEADAILNG